MLPGTSLRYVAQDFYITKSLLGKWARQFQEAEPDAFSGRGKHSEEADELNDCAMNRNITDQPRLSPANELSWGAPFAGSSHALARPYLLLCLIRHILRVVHPKSTGPQRMLAHLKGFPNLEHVQLNLAGMGGPENGQEHWQQAEL